jgi:hypothetical protein
MKMTVVLENGNRTVVEQLMLGETRKDFRAAISDMACRIELATFGPPGPVEAMTLEDIQVGFGNNA